MLDHRYYIWDNKAFQSLQTEQQNKPPAAEFKNLELHRMSVLGVVFGTSSRLTRPACATFSSVCFSFLCVFRCSLYTHDTSAPDSLQTCWHVGCCNFMQKQKTHSSSCKLKAVHWQKEKKKFLLFSQVHDNFAATDFFCVAQLIICGGKHLLTVITDAEFRYCSTLLRPSSFCDQARNLL